MPALSEMTKSRWIQDIRRLSDPVKSLSSLKPTTVIFSFLDLPSQFLMCVSAFVNYFVLCMAMSGSPALVVTFTSVVKRIYIVLMVMSILFALE